MTSPTVPPPAPEGMNSALDRNIAALTRRRAEHEASANLEERFAEAVSRFAGSLRFVYAHLVIFGLWVAANAGDLPGIPRFDPGFVGLATVASVEAIFLSTFILISQNRAAALADKRADLDLQVSLLTEHEVTRLIKITADIAAHLGLEVAADPEIEELKRDIAPEAVLDRIEDEGP
ncbi:MAG: DUF1003 domain-containing protein [Sphingomonadaceae bacterium]|nr:DUF1003 domain-containing protein [Sphingomonadaceae bacterium]